MSGGDTITGAQSLTKADAGTLFLSGPGYDSASTTINGGTLQLASGAVNTLLFNNGLVVNNNGTLDLNGGIQYVAGLISSGAAVNSGVAGGIINSNTGTGTIITNAAAQTFAGSIQGTSVNFVRSGASGNMALTGASTYGGATLINGGGITNNNAILGLTLTDNGALTNTTSIAINYSALNFSSSQSTLTDSISRVNTGATISLNGGALTLFGRASSLSSQSVGAVTLNQGQSFISSAEQSNNSTPVDGAALTLLSLGRTACERCDGAVRTELPEQQRCEHRHLGPQTKNIFITGGAPLTNNIMGGWATVIPGFFITNVAEFASYNSTNGVGALNGSGFAGTMARPWWPASRRRTSALPAQRLQ